ncbi:hypothetical protein ISN44_As02g013390 [Arabidopsis suecica]|uniref:Uncharacterized protein n=2 Tax=Arabidopsis TaxID=3701 RepID=A0A178VSP1_ARATH|nr:hypothetical protein ISN44_As02g013390 [Arabidopsis suecica]OAP08804.1 hypothetical protein AXX17_AT2G14660 [Arabidopsis thaliana]
MRKKIKLLEEENCDMRKRMLLLEEKKMLPEKKRDGGSLGFGGDRSDNIFIKREFVKASQGSIKSLQLRMMIC